jgi:hypothetical protein
MQTGQVLWILDDPDPACVFIWMIILFLGLVKGRLQFLGLQLKPSTELLQRRFGYVKLLVGLHRPLERATIVYCDNISSVYMASNLVQHHRTKHIEIDIHFVREKVALGEVRVFHIPTSA